MDEAAPAVKKVRVAAHRSMGAFFDLLCDRSGNDRSAYTLLALDVRSDNGRMDRRLRVAHSEIVIWTAVLAAAILNRAGRAKAVIDRLFQAIQIAPIALLPDTVGVAVFHFHLSPLGLWRSTTCVAFFALYPFARALEAFRDETIVPRLLLAADEALPCGAAAIAMNNPTTQESSLTPSSAAA
ncbi:MAG TPA: hypothetical protein VGA73_09380 [Candidatus Binatia bacterium]